MKRKCKFRSRISLKLRRDVREYITAHYAMFQQHTDSHLQSQRLAESAFDLIEAMRLVS